MISLYYYNILLCIYHVHPIKMHRLKNIGDSIPIRDHRHSQKLLRDIYCANNRLAWTSYFMLQMSEVSSCYTSELNPLASRSSLKNRSQILYDYKIATIIARYNKPRIVRRPKSSSPRVRLNFLAQHVISRHPRARVSYIATEQCFSFFIKRYFINFLFKQKVIWIHVDIDINIVN